MANTNPNFYIVPSAISITPNSLNNDPQHFIVGTSVGAAIKVTNQWGEKTWDGQIIEIGYADDLEYKRWYMRGAQYYLTGETTEKDVNLYVRVPKAMGQTADFAATVEELDIIGQYVTTVEGEESVVTTTNDYYFIKLCTLVYHADTKTRSVEYLDTGILKTPEGEEAILGSRFISKTSDDVAMHDYQFNSLAVSELIIGEDGQDKAHIALDENGNLKFFKSSDIPQNIYATGGVSALGMSQSAGQGSGLGGDVFEVWVGDAEPEDDGYVLWIDSSSSSASTVSKVELNAENHLIVHTSSDAAVLKAKIDGVWTSVSSVGSVNNGSNVSMVKSNQYPDGNLLAQINIDGVTYSINAPKGGEQTVVSGTDEVHIQTSEPTTAEAELWVNPNDKRQMIIGGYVDEVTGHLILNIPDPEPIIRARIDDEWVGISQGNGGGGGGTLSAISLRMPNEFVVSPSQLTTNGTFNVSLKDGYHFLTDEEREGLHTHSNKVALDELTSDMINVLRHLSLDGDNLKVDIGMYSTGALSAFGLGGGEVDAAGTDVEWNQIYIDQTNGEKIATITIDGTTTDVYAPKQTVVSGKVNMTKDEITETLGNYYLRSYTETDPIFNASAAKNITQDMITLLGKFSLVDGKVKVDADFFSSGAISAYGVGEGGEIESGDTVVWNQTYNDLTNGQKIATITINGTATDIYAPAGGSDGVTYAEGDYIDISAANKISVDLSSLKTALDYSKIVTTDNISQAVSGCSAQDITSALGYTPLESVSYSDLTVTPSQEQLTDIIDDYYALSGHDHDSTYLKLSGGTMTNNILVEKGFGIGYKFDDATRPHSNTQPWYGIAWFEDANDTISRNIHTHIGGYYGICLHTSANRTVRLYDSTEVTDTNSAPGKLQIGNAIITYDDTNKAIKIYNAVTGETCGLYTTGGITAYN